MIKLSVFFLRVLVRCWRPVGWSARVRSHSSTDTHSLSVNCVWAVDRLSAMLGALTDDALTKVFEELNAEDRCRFASLNSRHHKLLHNWADIAYLVAHRSGITVSSAKHIFEVPKSCPPPRSIPDSSPPNGLPPFVRLIARAPYIREVVISEAEHLRSVNCSSFSYFSHVDDLTLPSDMFCRSSGLHEHIKAAFSLKKLEVLRVLQLHDRILRASSVLQVQHANAIRAKRLRILKLQGVSVTAAALEVISMKYGDSLRELCLIGALVHTPDSPTYFQSIGRLKCLSRLSLPPSLYSLSREPSSRDFRMITALNLRQLSVHVFECEIIEIRFFLTNLLPKSLVELSVHDASGLFRQYLQTPDFQNLGFRFKVKYCEKGETLYGRDYMHGDCSLIAHLVWRSPYKAFPTEFHTRVPDWHCFLSEAVETQRENTEQTAVDSPPSPPEEPEEVIPPPDANHDYNEEVMLLTMARLLEQMMNNNRFEGSADRPPGARNVQGGQRVAISQMPPLPDGGAPGTNNTESSNAAGSASPDIVANPISEGSVGQSTPPSSNPDIPDASSEEDSSDSDSSSTASDSSTTSDSNNSDSDSR